MPSMSSLNTFEYHIRWPIEEWSSCLNIDRVIFTKPFDHLNYFDFTQHKCDEVMCRSRMNHISSDQMQAYLFN